jgi:hypothetical protein
MKISLSNMMMTTGLMLLVGNCLAADKTYVCKNFTNPHSLQEVPEAHAGMTYKVVIKDSFNKAGEPVEEVLLQRESKAQKVSMTVNKIVKTDPTRNYTVFGGEISEISVVSVTDRWVSILDYSGAWADCQE